MIKESETRRLFFIFSGEGRRKYDPEINTDAAHKRWTTTLIETEETGNTTYKYEYDLKGNIMVNKQLIYCPLKRGHILILNFMRTNFVLYC